MSERNAAAMRYDAFISYRHGELDGLVAERLHKLLETYRIPRGLAKKLGKDRLSRVFRDRDELPTSSNLSDSINEALENSSFLLLICSRRTCASQWVMREVERFGQLHGKDRIITLLIDGEPDESFPPHLREREVNGETVFVEPLAADIRAATWAGSLKLLKEEKLRLLSPVLGCRFDDLRRRHRRRRIQRVGAAVGAAFAFLLAFGSFSTYQYLQVNRQMQLKLENQSYVLSEYAERALSGGDPDMAAMLALSALPNNLDKPERPYVPEASRALSDALSVYDGRRGLKPYKAIQLAAAPGAVALSPGGLYAAACAPFSVTIYETETGRRLASLPTVQSALAEAAFADDDTIIYAGSNGLTAYDIPKAEELWRGAPATKIAVSQDGRYVAAVYKDDDRAHFYHVRTGARLEIPFGGRHMKIPADDGVVNPADTLLALNENGGRLAVSFADGSLTVFETGSGKETRLYPASNAVYCQGGFAGDYLAFSVVEKNPYKSAFVVAEAGSGRKIVGFESDSAHAVPYVNDGRIYAAMNGQIVQIDAATGAVTAPLGAGGPVVAFARAGDDALICVGDGARAVLGGVADDMTFGAAYHFVAMSGGVAVLGSRDSTRLRLLRRSEGAGEALYPRFDGEYAEARLTPTGDALYYSYKGLEIRRQNGGAVSVAFPDPEAVLDTRFDQASGNVAVLYLDRLIVYGGADGAVIADEGGKAGVPSVFYTAFGVAVFTGGEARLVDVATGRAQTMTAPVTAQTAVPIGGGVVYSDGAAVFYNDQRLAAGGIVGAAKTADGYAFAVSDGALSRVYTVASDGACKEAFAFEAAGRVEVYFTGGYVFVSPTHGGAAAYTLKGDAVRLFREDAYLAETEQLAEAIAAHYVSSDSGRYTLLLEPSALQTTACVRGFMNEPAPGKAIVDGGASGLRSIDLLNTRALVNIAKERLAGRQLTDEERRIYHAD